MGGVELLACQGFLVGGSCVYVLVGGAGSLWSAVKCQAMSFGVSVGLV